MNLEASGIGNGARWKGLCRSTAFAAALLFVSACQQKMAHQPYFRAQEESDFFVDGRSARPLEAGTVSRYQTVLGAEGNAKSIGKLPEDAALMSGLTPEGRVARKKLETSPEAPLVGAPDNVKNYVDEFPIPIVEQDIRRGMERFTIFCTPCHGPLGDGRGKIVERGYLRPTAYYQLRDEHGILIEGTGVARGFERFRVMGADGKPLLLQDVPVGYYFEVISKGFGGMPDHSAQIPPEDRWRIAAYIRTLQLSQAAQLSSLSKEDAEAVKKALKPDAEAVKKAHEGKQK
jgi:mono/diheme cytochrome c family protein